jgi:hypothetical protein
VGRAWQTWRAQLQAFPRYEWAETVQAEAFPE